MRGLAGIALGVVACGGGGGGGSPDGAPVPDGAPGAIDATTADATPPAADATPAPWPGCTACACTFTNLVPLTELGAGTYMGVEGGLYPGGGSARPAAHETTGLAEAQAIVPMDAAGNPDPAGQYVLVSIGMSNTTQEFSVFVPLAQADPDRDPRLVIVDGAQGAQTAGIWAMPGSAPWGVLDMRLAAAGVTPEQVAVAWVKLANPAPMGAFPSDADALAADLYDVAVNLTAAFPNLRVAYYSSRIYAGYATGVSMLNPEPYAYQSGFAVKQLVAGQIGGDPAFALGTVPWLSWGPYLWADGLNARADGLTYACDDLVMDGTHPSASGRMKVADLLLDFFKTDSTAREWFLASP